MKKAYDGFTLVEMALVLFIIGLLVGGILLPLNERTNQLRIKETTEILNQVKDALLGYLARNNRLPCPALNAVTGVENLTLCNLEGFIPWSDLGIGRYDSWGNPFRYRVDQSYTTTVNTAYIINTTSNLEVNDFGGTFLVSQNGTKSRIIAIIFSYGKDGQPNGDNSDSDKIFTQNEYIANSFDDQMTWLSENTVASFLAKIGKRVP